MDIEKKRKQQREAQKRYRERHGDALRALEKIRYAEWRLANPNYHTEWRLKNPDKVKNYQDKSNASPAVRAYQAEWRKANPDKVRAAQIKADEKFPPRLRQRKFRAKDPNPALTRAKAAEGMRNYRASNPERYKAVRTAWQHKNRERLLDYCAKRRGALRGKLSPGLTDLLLEEQGHKCPYCLGKLLKKSMTVDHYIPLYKGGPHEDWNIQLTCGPCNSRKSNKEPMMFFEERWNEQCKLHLYLDTGG